MAALKTAPTCLLLLPVVSVAFSTRTLLESLRDIERRGACAERYFTCANGKCIMASWACDKRDDCGDSSDETEELCGPPCSPNEFLCKINDHCIPNDWLCDTTEDCRDGEDERNCPTDCSGENQFDCGENDECIPMWHRCDDSVDCKNSTADQENCADFDCGVNRFKCSSSVCKWNRYLCDGYSDCPFGKDEDPEFCRQHGVTPES